MSGDLGWKLMLLVVGDYLNYQSIHYRYRRQSVRRSLSAVETGDEFTLTTSPDERAKGELRPQQFKHARLLAPRLKYRSIQESMAKYGIIAWHSSDSTIVSYFCALAL